MKAYYDIETNIVSHGSKVQIVISVHIHERIQNTQRCQRWESDGIMIHLR